MTQHLVIRASAGSGKTFQLSNRYLHLLLEGVSPQTILATTFTRKAAGEILDRILTRLAKGSLSPENCKALSQEVYGNENFLTQDKLLEAISYLAKNLHTLRVSTLDAFFSLLAGNFAPELDLPFGWRICDEAEEARMQNKAILSVFSDPAGPNAPLRLVNLLFKGETPRTLTYEIKNLIKAHLAILHETAPAAWKTIAKSGCLADNQRNTVTDAVRAAPLPLKKDGKPNGNVLKDVEALLKKYESEDRLAVFASKLFQNIASGNNQCRRIELDPELTSALQMLVKDAEAYFLNTVSAQTEATYEVFSDIAKMMEEQKRLNGGYRFDDLSYRLAERIEKLESEQLNFRLDNQTTHLLLDEFQDTSLLQWQVLRPLADFITRGYSEEKEKSFFCVGDTKQSIYRWRGGLPEIFDYVDKELPVDHKSLNNNWRSSPVILETVNRLFAHLSSNPIFEDGKPQDTVYSERRTEALRSGMNRWQVEFPAHTAARHDIQGFVSLEEAPLFNEEEPSANSEIGIQNSDDNPALEKLLQLLKKNTETEAPPASQDELTLVYAVKRIAQLHVTKPNASIGVLVRTNEMVGEITAKLAELDIEASQEGGVPLTAARSVRTVLALLRIADHPGDSAAKFRVATIPRLSEEFGFSIEQIHNETVGQALSGRIRNGIMTLGLGAFVREIAQMLIPFCDSREKPKLRSLVEEAFLFEKEGVIRLDRFIETIEQKKEALPTASHVHVMTIHRSKGLEYDIVVLPELDTEILPSRDSAKLIVHRPSPTEPADAVMRTVDSGRFVCLPKIFQDAYVEDWTAKTIESFNCLYVAMTRAVHELVMIVSPSAQGKTVSQTFENLLRGALTSPVKSPSPLGSAGTSLYSDGNPNWYSQTAWPEPPKLSAGFPEIERSSKRAAADRTAQTRAPSDKGFKRMWHPAGASFERGTAIHACFERIGWLDKEAPRIDELKKFLDAQFFQKVSSDEILEQFQTMLQSPETKALLSQSTYQAGSETPVNADRFTDPQWIVLQEHPFLTANPRGRIKGRIDRLVILKDGERTVGADIVDFKTDIKIPEPGTPEWEGYARQLDEYRKVVMKQYNLPKEKVAARLAFVTHGKVIQVA